MNNEYADKLLGQMFQQAKAQFGSAVKAFWFYDGDPCPGCGSEIDAMEFKGKEALSLNAFIYRERGILIGYFLCGRCAGKIFRDAEQNPYQQTSLHTIIKMNLVEAYQQHIRSMDA